MKTLSKEKASPIPQLTSHLSKQNKKCFRLRLIGGLTSRPDPVVLTSSVGVLLSEDPSCGGGKDGGVVSSF